MADRRRRPRVKSSEDSEEYSEGSGDEHEVDKASEAESLDDSKEQVVADSEYESAEEEGSNEKKAHERDRVANEAPLAIEDEGETPLAIEDEGETPLAIEDEGETPLAIEDGEETPSAIEDGEETPSAIEDESETSLTVEDEKKEKENEGDRKTPSPEIEDDVSISNDANQLEEKIETTECEEMNADGEEGGVEEAADETLIDGDVDGDEEGDEEEEEEDGDEEDEEEDEEEEEDEDEEDGEENEIQKDEQEWKEGEREQGDGQESQTQQLKEKVLDDDEDKRNPQYIPKKGGFYEHDDRLVDANEEEIKEEDNKLKGKKKLWREDNAWQHDRFNEDEQRPKSKDELVNAYGYDIRNENDAPRARRRRRFTGPTKYTRRSSDEGAYIKTSPKWKGPEIGRRGGRGRGRGIGGVRRGWARFPGGNGGSGHPGEGFDNRRDFRPRSFSNKDNSEKSGEVDDDGHENRVVASSHSESELEESNEKKSLSRENLLNPQNFPPLTKEIRKSCSPPPVANQKKNVENFGSEKPVRIEVRPRGGSRGGGIIRRGGGDRRAFSTMQRRDGRKMNNDIGSGENLARSIEKLSIKDHQMERKVGRDMKRDTRGVSNRHPSGGVNDQRRQVTVPPRLQEAAATNRPKRYSSQRQRNAGGYQRSPPPNAAPLPPRFYDHGVEYHSSIAEPGYQQQMYTDGAPPSNPPPPPQGNGPMIAPPPQTFTGYNPQGYQEPYGMRPMTSPPRMFAPVTIPTGTMAAVQPVMPSPYMSPNNNLINYGPPPTSYPQYTFTPTPQPPPPYSSAPPTVPTPQEFYRGGMAYYNTQSQHQPLRNHLKRPKAAIPIVPPPATESKDNENAVEGGGEKHMDVEVTMDESIHSAEVAVEG